MSEMSEAKIQKYVTEMDKARNAGTLAEIVFHIYWDPNLECQEKGKLYHTAFIKLYNHVRLTDAENFYGEDE